jgi:hypothetical protein
MFHVHWGKCLSRKAVHNWIEKFSQGRSKVADDVRPGAEVAETTTKRLLRCGFRSTGKMMRQVYQCWWRTCREINFSSCFEYHKFLSFICICDLFAHSRFYLVAVDCPTEHRNLSLNVVHIVTNFRFR